MAKLGWYEPEVFSQGLRAVAEMEKDLVGQEVSVIMVWWGRV